MSKYRKKPVVIEAVQFVQVVNGMIGVGDDTGMPEWLFEACKSGVVKATPDGRVTIATLEGTHTANPGDWIIQGVKGELYPCKPDIFEATYEGVHDSNDE